MVREERESKEDGRNEKVGGKEKEEKERKTKYKKKKGRRKLPVAL